MLRLPWKTYFHDLVCVSFSSFVFFPFLDFCSPRKALLHMDRVRTQLRPQVEKIRVTQLVTNENKTNTLVVSAAAPSWRRWTPSRRCGCRSGSTRRTEHVPSTGRPSKTLPGPRPPARLLPGPSPLRELPHVILSGDFPRLRYIRVPLRHRPPTHMHFLLRSTLSLPSSPLPPAPPPPPRPAAVRWPRPTSLQTHTQTHTLRGPSGCLTRGAAVEHRGLDLQAVLL